MPSDVAMRRLAIARYLHGQAIEQERKGDLLAGLALLPLHDATEIFLQTAAENCNVPLPRNLDFLQYWTSFESAGFPLPLRTQMDRFNRARVEVKHRGTLPAQHEVASFRATVTEFLATSSRQLFQIEFDEISMSRLVRSDAVRAELEEAEKASKADDTETAIRHAALAFRRALRNFRFGDPNKSWDKRLFDPLELGSDLRREALIPHSFDEHFARRVGDAFDRVSEAITVVAYNLDYDGYRHLLTFGPVIHEAYGSEPVIDWMVEPTRDQSIAERCIAFAIDAALRLENAVSRQA